MTIRKYENELLIPNNKWQFTGFIHIVYVCPCPVNMYWTVPRKGKFPSIPRYARGKAQLLGISCHHI
jgi:hypothetical protein